MALDLSWKCTHARFIGCLWTFYDFSSTNTSCVKAQYGVIDFSEGPKARRVFMSPAAQTHLLFDTLGDSVRLAAPEFVKLGQESPGLLTFQDFWESRHRSLK